MCRNVEFSNWEKATKNGKDFSHLLCVQNFFLRRDGRVKADLFFRFLIVIRKSNFFSLCAVTDFECDKISSPWK